MFSKILLTSKTLTIDPQSQDYINMHINKNYTVLGYTFDIEVTHDNNGALTVTPYQFFDAVFDKIILTIGSGQSTISLRAREYLVRQIVERGLLEHTIIKTTGNGNVSKFVLELDFLSLRMMYPNSTALRDVHVYDELSTTFETAPATGKVTNLTIVKTKIEVSESIDKGFVPLRVIDSNGKAVNMPRQNKRPLMDLEPFASDQSEFKIELLKDKRINKLIVYVTDTNGISPDHIASFAIENVFGVQTKIKAHLLEKNNRAGLNIKEDIDFNGIYVLNLAVGDYGKTLDTFKNTDWARTKLVLDLKTNGKNDLNVNVLHECIELATYQGV